VIVGEGQAEGSQEGGRGEALTEGGEHSPFLLPFLILVRHLALLGEGSDGIREQNIGGGGRGGRSRRGGGGGREGGGGSGSTTAVGRREGEGEEAEEAGESQILERLSVPCRAERRDYNVPNDSVGVRRVRRRRTIRGGRGGRGGRRGRRRGMGEVDELPEDEELVSPVQKDCTFPAFPPSHLSSFDQRYHYHIHPFPLHLLLLLLLQEQQGRRELCDKGVVLSDPRRGGQVVGVPVGDIGDNNV